MDNNMNDMFVTNHEYKFSWKLTCSICNEIRDIIEDILYCKTCDGCRIPTKSL